MPLLELASGLIVVATALLLVGAAWSAVARAVRFGLLVLALGSLLLAIGGVILSRSPMLGLTASFAFFPLPFAIRLDPTAGLLLVPIGLIGFAIALHAAGTPTARRPQPIALVMALLGAGLVLISASMYATATGWGLTLAGTCWLLSAGSEHPQAAFSALAVGLFGLPLLIISEQGSRRPLFLIGVIALAALAPFGRWLLDAQSRCPSPAARAVASLLPWLTAASLLRSVSGSSWSSAPWLGPGIVGFCAVHLVLTTWTAWHAKSLTKLAVAWASQHASVCLLSLGATLGKGSADAISLIQHGLVVSLLSTPIVVTALVLSAGSLSLLARTDDLVEMRLRPGGRATAGFLLSGLAVAGLPPLSGLWTYSAALESLIASRGNGVALAPGCMAVVIAWFGSMVCLVRAAGTVLLGRDRAASTGAGSTPSRLEGVAVAALLLMSLVIALVSTSSFVVDVGSAPLSIQPSLSQPVVTLLMFCMLGYGLSRRWTRRVRRAAVWEHGEISTSSRPSGTSLIAPVLTALHRAEPTVLGPGADDIALVEGASAYFPKHLRLLPRGPADRPVVVAWRTARELVVRSLELKPPSSHLLHTVAVGLVVALLLL